MKKLLSVFIITIILTLNCCASEIVDYKKELGELSQFIRNTVTNPTHASVGGEWSVTALSQQENISQEYFNKYFDNITCLLNEKNGVLSASKNTEYSRAIIGLTSMGKNACDASGYNLVEPILNYDKTSKQGINGAFWALIALECGNYYPEEKEIRKSYIEKILSLQSENGGFSLSERFGADPDVTAMAIQALSFYKGDEKINSAITKAEDFLRKIQNFPSCESVAQAIIAYTSSGKNSSDFEIQRLLGALSDFRCDGGGYSHLIGENKMNVMATEQVFCALVSLEKCDTTGMWLYNFKKPFEDISDSAYKNEINILSQSGIVGGRTEKMFFPTQEIRLSELCAMAAKALKLDIIYGNTDEDSWYSAYTSALYTAKILTVPSGKEDYFESPVAYREAESFFENCADFLEKDDEYKEAFSEIQTDGFLTREAAVKIIYEITEKG